jgi:hypothetical protein
MSKLYTYSDPTLSLWQSAAAEVHQRHASAQAKITAAVGGLATAATTTVLDDLMLPVHRLGAPLHSGKSIPKEILMAVAKPVLDIAAAAEKVLSVAGDCAEVAAQFLWAEMTGNQQDSDKYAGELKDSECDPLWAECLTTYLAYKLSGQSLPYRPNLNPVFPLEANTTLAIIGDWGTGDKVAINLLNEIKKLAPQVLLHLGDIYYAGTHNEEQANFLDICRTTLGNKIPIFSMCGNHDMYSGGQGYYWLVDQLNQQASYFCLENEDWQFLAMDTGHNDHNPLTVATNMTSLVTMGNWAEENWLLDKINLAGNRQTVLLSHHQLFSPFGSVGSMDGQPYAYNPNLRATFQAVMAKVAWWFWGHEHTLGIYDPYMNLQRGRCLGASAVPVFTDQQSYSSASGLQTYGDGPMPTWNKNAQLGNNGESYNNCFAIMTLNGPSANVDYYQVPIDGKATKFNVTDKNS